MKIAHVLAIFPALFVLSACGSESEGQGTVNVTAYGESFIEDGIPASEVGDDWAVEFTRFEVSIEDVSVGGVAISVAESVDLSESSSGDGHELGSEEVAEGDHARSSYTIARVEVDGTATKDAKSKSFSWVFDDATRYTECETSTSVVAGESATFQITVHADHLLYDSLVAEKPELLFQALADADTDEDGDITRAELSSTDIGAYDPGSEDGVDDLWSWLVAQSRTLGHVDGEGHCRATPLD